MLGAPAPCAETTDSANDLDSPVNSTPTPERAHAVSGEQDIQNLKHTVVQTAVGALHGFHRMQEFTFRLCLISSTVCSPICEKYIFPWGQFYLARKKSLQRTLCPGFEGRRARPAMLRFCLLSKLENLPPRRCGHDIGEEFLS